MVAPTKNCVCFCTSTPQELVNAESTALAALPAELRRLPDLERALMRMAHGTALPAEAAAALVALQQVVGHSQGLALLRRLHLCHPYAVLSRAAALAPH